MTKFLGRVGGLIAEHPKIAIGIVVFITILSIMSVAVNGLNSEFSDDSFMPDNEIANADSEMREIFESTYGVTVLVRSEEDIITQAGFLTALEFEAAVYGDQNISQYMIDPVNPTNSIVSPFAIVATAILQNMDQATLDLIGATAEPTYENLIKAVSVTPTQTLKDTVGYLLTSPETPELVKAFVPRLMTSDFDPLDAEAKGALLMFTFNKDMIASDEVDLGEGMVMSIDLERAMESHVVEDGDARVSVIGFSIINEEINAASNESLGMLFPLAAIAIVIILLFIYRDLVDTVIGLMGLVLAIVWMYGIGAALGYSFNPITTAVPILILGLGIDYGIHLVMRYREERSEGYDSKGSAGRTVLFVGEALMLATLTTVVAFLSNLTSAMSAILEFGVLCAIGILSSFVVMILIIPSTKVLRDTKAEGKGRVSKHYSKKTTGTFSLKRITCLGGKAAHQRPMAVIAVAITVTAVFGYGAANLQTTFDLNDFLPDELEVAKDLNFLMDEFNTTGGANARILLKGDITQPEVIRAMETSIANMADDPSVLKRGDSADTNSILSVMYDWAVDSSGPGYVDPKYDPTFADLYDDHFVVNGTSSTIRNDTTQADVQQLIQWLVDNQPGDLVEVIGTNGFEEPRGVIDVAIASNLESDEVWDLRSELMDDVEPMSVAGVDAVVAGETIATEVIMDELNRSQMTSLITTLIATVLILTAVMYYYRRSIVLGSLATLPVIFCVVWMWGTMFFLGIPLNVMTLMIASLTVGMGDLRDPHHPPLRGGDRRPR